MSALIYPAFEYKVKKIENKPYIFDIIRKKYIQITPEEWVRQHIIHWLINQIGYPKALIKIETGLIYNKRLKRTDIEVYDREGRPFLVVECKAVTILKAEDALMQALVYNTALNAPFLMISNGNTHYFLKKYEMSFEFIDTLPTFNQT